MFKNINAGPNLVDVCFLIHFDSNNRAQHCPSSRPLFFIISPSLFRAFELVISPDDVCVLGTNGISRNNDELERNLLDLKSKLAT